MKIYNDYPLKNVTTIGLGGYCKEFICPENINDLKMIIEQNALFIGNGSNVCFLTDYYDNRVISLKKMKKNISHDEKYISCTSNVSCTKLARYLFNNRISGYEFLYGIPGTIGGAIFMNAGAFHQEIMPNVHSIEVLDTQGKIFTLNKGQINYSYRSSNIDKNLIIISIKLLNKQLNFDPLLLSKLDDKRKETQPTNLLSCGCIFKNPHGDHAARLIEDAKLKGFRIGGLYVSQKHSNYFINDGTGSHQDFILLLNTVKDKIFNKYNIELTEEVVLIK